MISIEKCKKYLSIDLNEDEIESLRDALYAQANLAFDRWHRSLIKTKDLQNENKTII